VKDGISNTLPLPFNNPGHQGRTPDTPVIIIRLLVNGIPLAEPVLPHPGRTFSGYEFRQRAGRSLQAGSVIAEKQGS
jgi:hypothetical protein